MKLHDLFEAATSELYHNTRLYAAGLILEKGYFQLSTSVGTGTEREFQKPGKYYYFSTSRSKVGDYTLHNYHIDGVVFNLNGNWLNQRYKSAPVDYWERSWIRSGGQRSSEAEDRIYSTEPIIPLPNPPTKLITSIHVLFEIDKIKLSLDEDRFVRLRKLLFQAKRLGIPTYVYKTPNDWITQNPSKRIDTASLIKLMKPQTPEKSWSRPKREYLKSWRELYYKNRVEDLSPEAKRRVHYLYGPYLKDAINSLESDIHNQKSRNEPDLIKLIDIFKKLKINSPREYVDWLENKWNKITDK